MGLDLTKSIGGAINITHGSKYNGFVYFFHSDGTYSRFNRKTCELEYYLDIPKGWNNWPVDWPYPHTGITWDNDKVYFIRGPEYIIYNITTDTVEGSKGSVQADWHGWPSGWLDRVDAALYWGYNIREKRRKAYFFRDNQYIRYDVETNRVDDGYPYPINNETWPGWPSHWTQVWAAVDWGNGKVYFFSEEEYLRYDKFYDRVDDDYPRPLKDFLVEHKAKIDAENTSLLFENMIPSGERDAFTKGVRSISNQLDIRPNWLMLSMWFESSLNPQSTNPSNHVGLHHLMLKWAYEYWGRSALPAKYPLQFHNQDFKDLTEELKAILLNEYKNLGYNQLDSVKKFIAGSLNYKKPRKCRSFDQLRLLGFGGVGFAEIDRFLCAPDLVNSNSAYDLNKDNKIDVAEFREAVFSIIHTRFQGNPSEDSRIRHAVG